MNLLLQIRALLVLPCCTFCSTAAPIESINLTLESRTVIPSFDIDGKRVQIHTQGLFVTDRFYYITGRLEGELKKALFLRISREHLDQVESMDITPDNRDLSSSNDRADHPGGFDFDGEHFWVPISPSRPNSYGVILKIPYYPDRPLAEGSAKTAFRTDDHIGALAFDRDSKQLIGANWDTKIIYIWSHTGELKASIPQQNLQRPNPKTRLAVQDWKYLDNHRVIASGLDKNPNRDPAAPKSLVEIIDIGRKTVVSQARIARPSNSALDVTNEGVAILGNHLYFLPGDIGIESVIYSYRLDP